MGGIFTASSFSSLRNAPWLEQLLQHPARDPTLPRSLLAPGASQRSERQQLRPPSPYVEAEAAVGRALPSPFCAQGLAPVRVVFPSLFLAPVQTAGGAVAEVP